MTYIDSIRKRTDLNPEHVLTALYDLHETLNGVSSETFDRNIAEFAAWEKRDSGWLKRNHDACVGVTS